MKDKKNTAGNGGKMTEEMEVKKVGNVEEKAKEEVSEKKEEKADDKKEEKLEEKTAEKKEEKPEEKTDEKKEEKPEEKTDEKKEEKPEEKTDKKKEEKPEEKIDKKKEEKPEEKTDKKKEEKPEEKTDKKKEEKPEEKSDENKIENSENKNAEKTKNHVVSESKKLADVQAEKKKQEEDKKQEGNKKQEENNVAGMSSASKEPNKKSKKGLFVTLGVVAGLLLIVYVAGFVYFSGHFYQEAAINGVKVSGMNKETARRTLDNFYKNYSLEMVLVDGSTESIDASDINMVITLKDEFSQCLSEQNAYAWFVNMFQAYDFEIGADTAWNQEMLEDIYSDMDILKTSNMEKPQDAYVGVVDGKFVIVKEELGSTIDVEEFEKVVEESLHSVVASVDMVEMNCYDLPEIYEDDSDLKAELDAKNEYAENEIKLQLDDLTLEPGMQLYEDVLEKKGDGYEVSESKVARYVKKLAEEYDTLDTERTFTTSWNNRQIKTYGSAFGYVMNQEETVKALKEALEKKQPATVEVVFDSKGYTLQGENDIGDSYIEVNLSEQHVYAYKDGKKVAEGDCVSGNESAGNGTCIGLYAVQDKLSPTVLRGEKKAVTKTVTKKNKKGKKVKVKETTYEYEYESPVTYWMQFNGGIGLHDAAGWRSTYGGSIYYYSGSHGCVNLPLDLAQTLYETFDVGTPVIVYFWDNENRK
jgi:lipoprotein-anchoring transpeptidase ErfK/SrfK